MKLQHNFRKRIAVFGETYQAIHIDTDVDPENPLVLYRNLSLKTKVEKQRPRVAALMDWIEWDVNARKANAGRLLA